MRRTDDGVDDRRSSGGIFSSLRVALRPIYAKTAAYGHFGRELPEFTWEHTDRAEALKPAAGI
jgi:S-adenosylmethionine synthetase